MIKLKSSFEHGLYSIMTNVLIRKGNLDTKRDTKDAHTQRRTCEDTARRHLLARQEEVPQKKPNLLDF